MVCAVDVISKVGYGRCALQESSGCVPNPMAHPLLFGVVYLLLKLKGIWHCGSILCHSVNIFIVSDVHEPWYPMQCRPDVIGGKQLYCIKYAGCSVVEIQFSRADWGLRRQQGFFFF